MDAFDQEMALLDTLVGIRIKLGATEDDAVEMTTVTMEVEYPEFPDPWQRFKKIEKVSGLMAWALVVAGCFLWCWRMA